MNNTKVFVVVAYGGEYESAFENAVIASLDKQKAEEQMAELQQKEQERQNLKKEINNFRARYDESHPHHVFRLKTIKWPSFEGLKEHQITKEMRDERARIKEQNKKIMADQHKLLMQWYNERQSAMISHFASLGLSQETIESNDRFRHDREFRIDEIPLI